MSMREQWIEVNAPISTAYDHWAQFESFPDFNNGVATFRLVDDNTTRIVVQLDYVPEDAVLSKIEEDLQRFKKFIESEYYETRTIL